MKSLVLIQTENQQILPSSLSALTAAKKLGGEIDAVLLGETQEETVKNLLGIQKVYLLPQKILEGQAAEILKNLSQDYTHILAANTSEAKNILPRLAGLLDVQPITEVTDILASDIFVRPVYAGAALAKVQSKDKVKILLIRSASFEPSELTGSPAEISPLSSENLVDYLVVFLEKQTANTAQIDLETAKIIVSGGKGFKSAAAFNELLQPLADILNAGIGASRAAVDSDFAPNELQIGQTGKIVSPDLYLAVGVSGAPQHLAGIKDSKIIFAINIDPQAPIFSYADYGIEADLFEILPELTAELQKLSK